MATLDCAVCNKPLEDHTPDELLWCEGIIRAECGDADDTVDMDDIRNIYDMGGEA